MEDMTNEERKRVVMETKKISTRIKFNEKICSALSSRIETIEKQNDVLQGEKQKRFDDYKTYRGLLKKQMLSSKKTIAKKAKKEYACLEKMKTSAVNTFDKVVARFEPYFDKYKGFSEFREGSIPSSLRMLSEAKETKKRANKNKKTSDATNTNSEKNEEEEMSTEAEDKEENDDKEEGDNDGDGKEEENDDKEEGENDGDDKEEGENDDKEEGENDGDDKEEGENDGDDKEEEDNDGEEDE
jgi:hypothetical protein